MIRRPQNQQISRNSQNHEKSAENDANELPDTFQMQFRLADAAKRVNRDDLAPETSEK